MGSEFDDQLKERLIAFQTQLGLVAHGIADSATWQALISGAQGQGQPASGTQGGGATVKKGEEDLADDPYPATGDGEQPQLFSLSSEGYQFIKRHEGVKKKLYNDSQGHCTIGVGHLVHKGNCDGSEPENFKRGLTDDEVDALFQGDLEVYESAVSNAITSRINQYQYDALVSFTFNIGVGGFRSSGALKAINAKHYSKVPDEMLKWNKPPEIQGRRSDEANLFRTGSY